MTSLIPKSSFFLDYDELRAGFHIIAMTAAKKLRESLDHSDRCHNDDRGDCTVALIWKPTLGYPRLAS